MCTLTLAVTPVCNLADPIRRCWQELRETWRLDRGLRRDRRRALIDIGVTQRQALH